jgi:hypothetical protein
MPKILVKALLHSILSQEFCLRFVFTLPAKPQLKPYVTLCKSCRLYSHLQVCFLVNLNFYLKFWSFGWSNGRWPNAFGALGAWARSRASRYRDAITTWRRSHRQHLGSRPQYCHGPARISLHRPVDRPELRGTLTPSRVARPHPCRRAPSLRSFPYLLATLLQAQDHALASGAMPVFTHSRGTTPSIGSPKLSSSLGSLSLPHEPSFTSPQPRWSLSSRSLRSIAGENAGAEAPTAADPQLRRTTPLEHLPPPPTHPIEPKVSLHLSHTLSPVNPVASSPNFGDPLYPGTPDIDWNFSKGLNIKLGISV